MTTTLENLDKLTPRELDVVELVAEGFSSRYVAQRLHISVRTVDTHMTHIYDRLGIHSRDELVELRLLAQGRVL